MPSADISRVPVERFLDRLRVAVHATSLGSVETLVQTGNYCGPTAQEPAAVVLTFTGQRLVARPAAGDSSSGVPPCMGEAGPTDDITMQPWGTAQG